MKYLTDNTNYAHFRLLPFDLPSVNRGQVYSKNIILLRHAKENRSFESLKRLLVKFSVHLESWILLFMINRETRAKQRNSLTAVSAKCYYFQHLYLNFVLSVHMQIVCAEAIQQSRNCSVARVSTRSSQLSSYSRL